MTRSFDAEQQMLGWMLSYPTDTARLVLPHLGADRFIYGIDGSFGADHQRIWEAAIRTHSEGDAPSISMVGLRLRDRNDLVPYLGAMTQMLKNRWQVREFDSAPVMSLRDEVDKNGGLYRDAIVSRGFAATIETPDTFDKFVSKVPDVDEFIGDHIGKLHRRITGKKRGYKPVSETADTTLEFIRRVRNGEQLLVLDCGIPTLRNLGLPRMGESLIIHGESSGGKSLVTNLVNLGVAINLYLNNIPGCVLINSMEESERNLHMKFASILMSVDISPLMRGQQLTYEEYENLEKGIEFCKHLPILIDDTSLLNPTEVANAARTIHTGLHGPIQMMTLDYLGLMNLKVSVESKEAAISELMRQRIGLVKELGAAGWDISQTTDQSNQFHVAGANGVRGSKEIRMLCDIQLESWNPISLQKQHPNFKAPATLDDFHYWLLIEKDRNAGLSDPVSFIWQGEYKRILDIGLNPDLARNKPRVFDFDLDIDRELGITTEAEEDYSWKEF